MCAIPERVAIQRGVCVSALFLPAAFHPSSSFALSPLSSMQRWSSCCHAVHTATKSTAIRTRFFHYQQRRLLSSTLASRQHDNQQRENDLISRTNILAPFFTGGEREINYEKHRHYPVKTAEQTASLKTPPTCARMLARDYIDDSLYNPNYGYFSKQAVIFSPEVDIDFTELRDNLEFQKLLANMYREIEGEVDEVDEVARQVWHTPTELFKVRLLLVRRISICTCGLTHLSLLISPGMVMQLQSIWCQNTS